MGKIREFQSGDYPEICGWFKAHGLSCPDLSHLPVHGFIVPEIAAGFIYMTDSTISILDCFISNPHSDDKRRDMAIDLIVLNLAKHAKIKGTKILITNTRIQAVRLRALDLGFNETGKHFSFVKELN